MNCPGDFARKFPAAVYLSHQLDYLDYLFGPIMSVKGFAVNQTGMYPAEDMVSACFTFKSGVIGTGTWCFTASKETNTDQIEIIGSKGKITFSTFAFTPVQLGTESGIETFNYQKFYDYPGRY
ncbi:Gfo/Idh/MocA family oxidoreductase [Acidobacteriota bacterium]